MKTLLHDVALFLLYTFTALLALAGNATVFLTALRNRHKCASPSTAHFSLSTTRVLLLHLALVDTVLGLTLPIQILLCSRYFLTKLTYSAHVCAAAQCVQVLTYNVSTLTICLIAYDRYRLIHNPLCRYYPSRLPRALLLVWMLSAVFSGSYFASAPLRSTQRLITCQPLFASIDERFTAARIFCELALFYVIPLLLITVLCVLTMRVISRRLIVGVQRFRTFGQSRTRSLGLLLLTAGIFTASRSPIHLVHVRKLWSASTNQCDESTTYQLIYWLNISSCCHNPIIYSWLNRRFRTSFFDCCHRLIVRKCSELSSRN